MIKIFIITISIFIEQIYFLNQAFSLIKIYAAENPPLSIKNQDETFNGIGGEIMKEALDKAQIKTSVEWVPWLRAMESVAKTPNSIIFPLGDNKGNRNRRRALF
jgi:hypothetical protein